jgi:hypothetical protein
MGKLRYRQHLLAQHAGIARPAIRRGAGSFAGGIKTEQRRLAGQHGRYVPLAIKIAPDLADEDLADRGSGVVAARNRRRDRHQHHLFPGWRGKDCLTRTRPAV